MRLRSAGRTTRWEKTVKHRLTRLLLAAGAVTTAIAALAATATSSSAAASVRAGIPKTATTTTVSDYWEQTHHNIHVSTSGGAETPIMTLALPAGKWILHADQTIVNFGASDFAGCSLADGSNSNLNTHRTIVGDPNASGASGASAVATTLSETAAVSLSTPTRVTVLCEHDTSSGASTYIDANADLWAHRTSSLAIIQLP
jgi:hypothetical protein